MKLQIGDECGGVLEVDVVRASGLSLICQIPAGPDRLPSTIAVVEHQAVDPAAFWAAWKAAGGQGEQFVWESGEPYQLPPLAVPGVAAQTKRSWLRRWIDGILDRLLGA